MTTDAERSLEVLARALDQTDAVLSTVTADRLADPTPCIDWDVGALIAHVVADTRNFVIMARGDEPDWDAKAALPDDWTGEFRSGADELIGIWGLAGESASVQSMDLQTGELAVHTWDLVRALGLSTELDAEVARRGLDLMSGALTPDNRGDAFAPEVKIGDDAPIYDRLAAFAGRNPR
jgi:uncharacterized protein (TIGR03086 family)